MAKSRAFRVSAYCASASKTPSNTLLTSPSRACKKAATYRSLRCSYRQRQCHRQAHLNNQILSSARHAAEARASFAAAFCRRVQSFTHSVRSPPWPRLTTVFRRSCFPAKATPGCFRQPVGKRSRPPAGYGRFAHAAYAIRFAIEELPSELLPDACLEVNAELFDRDGIRRLYDSEDYPLVRRATSVERMSQSDISFKA